MHIPDNYLSPQTCAVLGAVMIPVWAVSVKKTGAELNAKKIPLLGISAAFAFLIMMFNIPLPGGTTGHAVGAALAAILIGPYAAVCTMTIALFIQALLFGDGGILAFGANCFTMAFVMPFTGYALYVAVKRIGRSRISDYAAALVSAYVSLNFGALVTAVLFGLQPLLFKDAAGLPLYCPYALQHAIPAMMIPHLLIAGSVEAVITVGVLMYIQRISPELIHADIQPVRFGPLYALLGVLAMLTPLGLLAGGSAWGEWALSELKIMLGYIPEGMQHGFSFNAPFSDYALPLLKNEIIGYTTAALAGAALLIFIFRVTAAFFKNRR